ncbi:hypothetical protein H9638_05210 [Arthrobacter sp. Sa2BUA2]|uniref:Uncharacterized protein n=1 Tax=Arthrobacter pullicola TaxID=2762224 RepID=A0ABR8YGD8_9MICC|nr:hypothetical protein [Arthrobacter pullicola]MBD8043208.1 hypothetical protein [Arthrobacter pullicola]
MKRRIRIFSVLSGLVAVVLLGVLLLPAPYAAFSTAAAAVGWQTTPLAPQPRPWEPGTNDPLVHAETSDGSYRWSGSDSAQLDIPDELLARAGSGEPLPVLLEGTSEGLMRLVRMLEATSGASYPSTVLTADEPEDGQTWAPDPSFVLLDVKDNRFYVEASGQWTVEAEIPLLPAAAGGSTQGNGSGIFRYDGAAASGRFDTAGRSDPLLYVLAHSAAGTDFLGVPDEEGRLEWDTDGPIWFQVYASGPWTFQADPAFPADPPFPADPAFPADLPFLADPPDSDPAA